MKFICVSCLCLRYVCSAREGFKSSCMCSEPPPLLRFAVAVAYVGQARFLRVGTMHCTAILPLFARIAAPHRRGSENKPACWKIPMYMAPVKVRKPLTSEKFSEVTKQEVDSRFEPQPVTQLLTCTVALNFNSVISVCRCTTFSYEWMFMMERDVNSANPHCQGENTFPATTHSPSTEFLRTILKMLKTLFILWILTSLPRNIYALRSF